MVKEQLQTLSTELLASQEEKMQLEHEVRHWQGEFSVPLLRDRYSKNKLASFKFLPSSVTLVHQAKVGPPSSGSTPQTGKPNIRTVSITYKNKSAISDITSMSSKDVCSSLSKPTTTRKHSETNPKSKPSRPAYTWTPNSQKR
jgi:hypothetical protein